MRERINIEVGQRFNRLIFLGDEPVKNKHRIGKFVCDCGKITITDVHSVRYGKTKSCGCYVIDKIREVSIIHGETINRSSSPEYSAWRSMRERCYNKNCVGYENYGGRGIKVCDRWLNSFVSFLEDVGRRPSNKHSIDRIEVNGNYEPSNVRWATPKTQRRNQRFDPRITINGVTKLICEWAEESSIPRSLISGRLKKDWDAEKAVFTPVDIKKRNHRFDGIVRTNN